IHHHEKSPQERAKRASSVSNKHSTENLSGLSELNVPSPIQNGDETGWHRRHTLEENIEAMSRGEDPDDEEDQEDGLRRNHTFQENIQLAWGLSQDLRRRSQELRRIS
ncbi:uncharacterized protein A1O9_09428, partial [Exophiala aquamarina CBS 119918]